MSRAPRGRPQHGVSLIQLLVGMAIGTSLAAALATFFIQNTRSSREDINVASMLNELGFATGQLGVDLEMAGFWARVHDASAIDLDGSLSAGNDCGGGTWYRNLRALEMLDNPTAAAAHAAFPCIPAADLVGGSDLIAIKRVLGRVAGTDTSTAALRNGTMYLRTHDRHGVLYLRGAGSPAVEAPYEEWQYSPSLYYVQPYTAMATESPRVPALCRMTLRSSGGGAPSFTRECVAQGVENIQLEVGVDTDEDGAANYFTASPTAADLNRASTARLYVLVRSARADVNYVNAKTYQVGNAAPFTPAGDAVHYYRKALSTEVALRNPRGLQGVAIQ